MKLRLLILVISFNQIIFAQLDKHDIYWEITKAPYREKPPQKLNIDNIYISHDFKLKEDVPPIHHIYFVVWNILDIYTTHQAINVGGYAREANPLFPSKPSVNTLVTRKFLISSFFYSQKTFEDKRLLKFWNLVGTGTVLHNLYVMHEHGDFL
jgi:hypothetical protein